MRQRRRQQRGQPAAQAQSVRAVAARGLAERDQHVAALAQCIDDALGETGRRCVECIDGQFQRQQRATSGGRQIVGLCVRHAGHAAHHGQDGAGGPRCRVRSERRIRAAQPKRADQRRRQAGRADPKDMGQPHRGIGDARQIVIGFAVAHHRTHAVGLQRGKAARQRGGAGADVRQRQRGGSQALPHQHVQQIGAARDALVAPHFGVFHGHAVQPLACVAGRAPGRRKGRRNDGQPRHRHQRRHLGGHIAAQGRVDLLVQARGRSRQRLPGGKLPRGGVRCAGVARVGVQRQHIGRRLRAIGTQHHRAAQAGTHAGHGAVGRARQVVGEYQQLGTGLGGGVHGSRHW